MALKVYLLDVFKDLPGTVTLEEGSITVGEIIDILEERYGPAVKEKLLNGGRLKEGLVIYVNGNNIRFLKDMDTVVHDGDEVVFAPLIAGG